MFRQSTSCVLLAASLAAQHPYQLVDLGVLPGASGSVGRGISPDGRRIVGWSGNTAFVWEEGVGMLPLPMLPGYSFAAARDVDSHGNVVGTMGLEVTGPAPARAVRWNPGGTITNLGTIGGGRFSMAFGINDLGQIAGYSEVLSTTTLWHAFLWGTSGMVDLTPATADTFGYDVNQFGEVAGYDSWNAFRHSPMTGTLWLGQPPGFTFSTGMAINDAGQVAGSVTNASGSSQRMARWTDGIGWEVFGGAGNDNQLSGINSFGQVVGTGLPPAGGYGGVLYTDGLGMQHLNTLVDPAVNSWLKYAHSINDRGQISGHRYDNTFAQFRAFRLDPQFMTVYGQGCAGGNGHVPKLAIAGLPKAQNRIVIMLAEGAPGGVAVLVLSGSPAAAPIGFGCTVSVALPAPVSVLVPLDQLGQGRMVLDLPAGSTSGTVYLQYASIDLAAPNGLLALSNGVALQIL
ncbi:MAG TPA: hypothetical protein VF384_09245 [Planctomycetota bacterium]